MLKKKEEEKRIKNIQSDFVVLYFFLKGSGAQDNNIAVEQEQLE